MSGIRAVDASLIRRIVAAVDHSAARRSLIEEDWPECHRKGCQHRHGNVDAAFGNMKARIIEDVQNELRFEATTRPDVFQDEGTPEQAAVYTLAILMSTYNVHKTSTFVNAARLMVDAYPTLIDALTDTQETSAAA